MAKATNKATKATSPKANAKATKVASAKKATKVEAKVSRPRLDCEFDRSPSKTNWSEKQIAQARAKHDHVTCRVNGKTSEYTSLWKAFLNLGLASVKEDAKGKRTYEGATSAHQVFRKALKIKGKLPFVWKGKRYDFAIVKGDK